MRSARAIGLSRARRSFAAATRNFDGLCSALIFCFSEPHRRWVRLRLPVPAIGAAEKWSRRSQKDQDNLQITREQKSDRQRSAGLFAPSVL
jgi:hypothetical protein